MQVDKIYLLPQCTSILLYEYDKPTMSDSMDPLMIVILGAEVFSTFSSLIQLLLVYKTQV